MRGRQGQDTGPGRTAGPFNSLFEMHKATDAVWHYCNHISFQFSIWDAGAGLNHGRYKTSLCHFQFSIWDAAPCEDVWIHHNKITFQFSIWDAVFCRGPGPGRAFFTTFQFSIWDAEDFSDDYLQSLTIAFNSLFEMRARVHCFANRKYVFFQFSIWDAGHGPGW